MKRFLVGKRISLHGLLPEYLSSEKAYYGWLDDLSLDSHTERSIYPNSPERMKKYYERAVSGSDMILLGIFDNESNRHIGNVTLSEINYLNRRASIAYLLGEKDFAGKGIATEAVMMMMYYGFNRLNLDRIAAGVSDRHIASKKVCNKAGLIEEGRLRNYLVRNGESTDAILYSALRNEWMTDFGEKARSFFSILPTY